MLLSRIFGENVTETKYNRNQWQRGIPGGWLTSSDLSSIARRKLVNILQFNSALLAPVLDAIGPLNMCIRCGKSSFPYKVIMRTMRVPDNYSTPNSIWVFRRFIENRIIEVRDLMAIKISASPSDFYYINFIRYPTAVDSLYPPQHFRDGDFNRRPDVLTALKKRGEKEWIRESPYLDVLDAYLDTFYGERNRSARNENAKSTGLAFLRLCCEFWMDVRPVIRSYSGSHQVPETTQLDLVDENWMYREFAGCKESCLQCIYLMVKRLSSVRDMHVMFLEAQEGLRNNAAVSDLHASGCIHLRRTRCQDACTAPPFWQIVYQPLFDLLRYMLCRPITNGDTKSFLFAVEIWLLWIQPWKHSSDGSRTYVSKKWRPYVVANMHMYTTLHGIFMRSMSETEVGNSEGSAKAYVDLLQKVTRVFGAKDLARDLVGIAEAFRKFKASPCYVPEVRHADLYRCDDGSIAGAIEEYDEPDSIKRELFTLHAAHVTLFPADRGSFDLAVLDVNEFCTRRGAHNKSINQTISEVLATQYDLQRGTLQKVVEFFGIDARWTERDICAQVRGLHDNLSKDDETLMELCKQRKGMPIAARGNYRDETLRGVSRKQDNLESPYLSSEWPFVGKTITLSKWLNDYWQLPQLRDSNSMTWQQIFGRPREWKDVATSLRRVKLSFRFNLRFLADIRTSCLLLLVITYMGMIVGLISSMAHSMVCIAVAMPLYYGAFSAFPIRRKYI